MGASRFDRLASQFANRHLSRRSTLAAAGMGAAGVTALAFGVAGRPASLAQIASPTGRPPVELPQPKVLTSADGVLALTLTATASVVDMGAPQKVTTYTYNDVVPGHTLEINPGDTLKIDLVNNLPPLPHAEPVDMTRPHEWMTTNLHTHGLHVSPAGNADNPFIAIAPGETYQYEIPVPDDHPGGLFWYHPHRHGAVAHQVRAGMAGALVVRGEIDEVEEVRAANELLLVLQAIELGNDYQLQDPIPNPTKDEAFFPRDQILYTVNGVLNPTITMYPGEVQRWRLLNAAEGKFMSLRLAEHDLHVLAWDGLTLAAPDTVTEVMLSGGNRVELLVQAGRPGAYDLILAPGSSQKPEIPGMPHGAPTAPATPVSSSELQTRPILTIEVTGSGPELALPTALPAWDPPILPIARMRQFAYTVERDGDDDDEFIDFGVNGLPFDPERPPYQVKLGTAEEWTLTNGLDHKLHEHAHVFHIHVNPFKITKINGKTLDLPLWRDTFVLTGKTGDSITFESNFVDFTGKTVDHCHVLSHEDLGMMEVVEIIP